MPNTVVNVTRTKQPTEVGKKKKRKRRREWMREKGRGRKGRWWW
jgi:hypothetical protein